LTAPQPLEWKRAFVRVNGIYRWDANVSQVIQREGLAASEVILEFQFSYFNQFPVHEGDTVIVWINPWIRGVPVFRGRVENPTSVLRLDYKGTSYVCKDDRARLWDCDCNRNYNERDEHTGELIPHPVSGNEWTTLQIANDLATQYHAWAGTSTAPEISTSGLSNSVAGEQTLRGLPIGEALQSLLETAGGGRVKSRLDYVPNSQVKFYTTGSGFQAQTRRGTMPTVNFNLQPSGPANVAAMQRNIVTTDAVNRLIVEGERKKIETARQLTVGWPINFTINSLPVTDDQILANNDKYTKEGSDDEPNPNYAAAAELVGRRFLIPEVTDNERSRQAKILPTLLQDYFIEEGDGSFKKSGPVAIVKWTAAGAYKIAQIGFSIDDDAAIIFSKPLIEDGKTAIPYEVWLLFAYESEVFLSYDTGSPGTNYPVHRRRRISKEDFRYEIQTAPWFTFSANGAPTKHASGSNVLLDESTGGGRMVTWAAARLAEMKESKELWSDIELPGMPLGYEVGMRFMDNYHLTDLNIIGVVYDIPSGKTILEVGSL